MSGPVNLVEDLQADPLGSTNSASAVQAMAEHDHAGYIPPGLYLVNNEVDWPIPKIVWGFGGDSISTGFDNGSGVNFGPGHTSLRNPREQVVFYTTNQDPNFNMFTIRKADVNLKGFLIDFQNLTGHNGAGILYDLDASNGNPSYAPWATDTGGGGRAMGRNGSLRGITIMGNVNRLRTTNPGQGSVGVKVTWPDRLDTSLPNKNAFLSRLRWEVKGLGLDTLFDLQTRQVFPVGHWANNSHFRGDAYYCRQILRDECFFGVRWYLNHWAGDVFNTQANAEATPSIFSSSPNGLYYQPTFYDFRGLSGQVHQDPTSGYWYNQKTVKFQTHPDWPETQTDVNGNVITPGAFVNQSAENYILPGLSADDYARAINVKKGPPIRIYSDIQRREGAQIL